MNEIDVRIMQGSQIQCILNEYKYSTLKIDYDKNIKKQK